MSFAMENSSYVDFALYSDCQCEDFPVKVEGTCKLSGYVFNTTRDGSAFTPVYPGSSPWVTSVGATQVRLPSEALSGT